MGKCLHYDFIPITIHTAKCDRCNRNNKAILYRCKDCGFHICTPCVDVGINDNIHVLNAGEGGRPRIVNSISQPKVPTPEPVSPILRRSPEIHQDVRTEMVQNLPALRKQRARKVIEESDDESVTQNVRNKQKRRRRAKEDRGDKTMQRTESSKPARITRAAAKAASEIEETADYLLALGLPSPQSTISATGEDRRDEVGLMLLAEAVALTEHSPGESIHVQDAQVQSPLFVEEEIDLVTLRGSEVVTERETSVDDTVISQAARWNLRRQLRIRSEEPLHVADAQLAPAALTYSLPSDTVVIYDVRQHTVSQRLRDLYQSSMVVKRPGGSKRSLWRPKRVGQ